MFHSSIKLFMLCFVMIIIINNNAPRLQLLNFLINNMKLFIHNNNKADLSRGCTIVLVFWS